MRTTAYDDKTNQIGGISMIKLIVGKKGTGKTKILIDMVNQSLETSGGNVVVLEKGAKLTYDLKHTARLIDVEHYDINGYGMFYGFVSGILACDYDITDLYVDSILKIGGRDFDALGTVLDALNKVAEENNTRLIFTVSADAEELPDSIKKYL